MKKNDWFGYRTFSSDGNNESHKEYDNDENGDDDNEKKDNGIEYEACGDQIHFPFELQLSMNPINAMHSNLMHPQFIL